MKALRNVNTGANYIPYFKLVSVEGTKKTFIPRITNGIIDIELTPERMDQCEEIEMDPAEWAGLTKNLKIVELPLKDGDMRFNAGYVFTADLYQVSDEYMKKHDLMHKNRIAEHNPLYTKAYGSLDHACTWLLEDRI